MKKILAITLLVQLALGASAQHFRGGFQYARPRVSVGIGLGYYSPFYPNFGYSPFGYYPSYRNGYPARPSKLTMKIQDIKNDYEDRIYSVKLDTSLSHHERRVKVRELKRQRDQEIDNLKRNYYKY